MAAMRAIGLMSGTSLDGVDAALVETDGERITRLGPTFYRAYAPQERALLATALAEGARLTERDSRPGVLAHAEALVGDAHAEAVEGLLMAQGMARESVDLIGFHGQTVLHRPELGLTVQIGDGPALARRLAIPVVYDFRAADVAAGGQGAPLVPVFHRALVRKAGLDLPVGVLNVGGVANVTLIFSDGGMLAFDTGPGNALVDDLMAERLGESYDEDGAHAARGTPDQGLLEWLLHHPYFRKAPPKSLDRNWFSHRIVGHLATEDAAATLLAFTIEAVARGLEHAREKPSRWLVAGGGAQNGELMRRLQWTLQAHVTSADAVGWSAAFLEAQAFAFLAVRSLQGLPLTYPDTTGVPRPLPGGVLARP